MTTLSDNNYCVDLAIFGVTGDLSRRKILPALYSRMCAGQISENTRIIGLARSAMKTTEFHTFVKNTLEKFVPLEKQNKEQILLFLKLFDYIQIEVTESMGWDQLQTLLNNNTTRIQVFYLSISPNLFGAAVENMVRLGLNTKNTRIVVEKPFGNDFASAKALNDQLASGFDEKQIYRIDHYLGKESVQNLMALRFANSLFEPLWNREHIDHVQISVAEEMGVEGRGEYYDQSGAMRDMVQNHLLQLLCLIAMEPPSKFEANAVRDEKLKIIKSLQPITAENTASSTVRGQYLAGNEGKSYQEDVGNPSSNTESYLALKVHIDNWRWSGTPFYLRTGKRLRTRLSEIAVFFKDTPHSMFGEKKSAEKQNALIIRLQPDENITLYMSLKDPSLSTMELRDASLDLSPKSITQQSPEAYERLIMDVIRADQTLFMHIDEVLAAWKWVDPIIQTWQKEQQVSVDYHSGSDGPTEADALLKASHHYWRGVGE